MPINKKKSLFSDMILCILIETTAPQIKLKTLIYKQSFNKKNYPKFYVMSVVGQLIFFMLCPKMYFQ